MDPKLVEELLELTFIGSPKHQPGTRPVHSFGIAALGHFRGSTHAQRYCGAEQFSTDWTPTVVRFSNSQGQDNPEFEPQIRGMAVKFFNHAVSNFFGDMVPAADDQAIEEVDLICTGLPNFFAAKPESLLGLFKALKPEPVTPPTRLERLLANLKLNPLPQPAVVVTESAEAAVLKWTKDHPESHAAVAALGLNATQPPPDSFGRSTYHAVHAFNVVGNDGSRHVARFSFEPVRGVRAMKDGALFGITYDEPRPAAKGANYEYQGPHHLRDELRIALDHGMNDFLSNPSVRFTLRMTLADPWDDPADPTVVWPSNRRQVIMGTLDLEGLYFNDGSDAASADGEKLSFNPGRLPRDHMYPTDDELLKARIAVYNLSQERRPGANQCPVMH